MSVARTLSAAGDLIEPEGRWLQHFSARGRRKTDKEDQTSAMLPTDPGANRWSALGAIWKVAKDKDDANAAHRAFETFLGERAPRMERRGGAASGRGCERPACRREGRLMHPDPLLPAQLALSAYRANDNHLAVCVHPQGGWAIGAPSLDGLTVTRRLPGAFPTREAAVAERDRMERAA